MRQSFSRRIATHSFVLIGGSLCLLTLVLAASLLGGYVSILNGQTASAVARAPAILAEAHVMPQDADAAVRALAARIDSPQLRMWAVNDRLRVAVVKHGHTTSILHLPRIETEFVQRPLGARLAAAVATGFGLQLRRVHLLDMYLYFTADDQEFQTTLLTETLIVIAFFAGAFVFAIAMTRALTREALRPLNDVAFALESFAAGNFSAPAVKFTSADPEMRRLTTALNGAMATVNASLQERDEAQDRGRRFIADAAHQLRTPLTVIAGFAGILKAAPDQTREERLRILASINKQTVVMSALVDKLTLLDHWEREPASCETMQAWEVVRDVALPFAATQPDGTISLVRESDAYINCDMNELEEALSNIIDNALKYAKPAPILISVEESASEVFISVTDQGRGLSTAEQAHAFDRFFRGEDREIAGSGLGLAIAQSVVERAGGRITLQSRTQVGTTVSIALPRVVAPSQSRGGMGGEKMTA